MGLVGQGTRWRDRFKRRWIYGAKRRKRNMWERHYVLIGIGK